MAFHNVIFPTMLKVGSRSGRRWEVDVYENSMSGAEQRNLYHANGRRVFTIEKGSVTETQKDELMAFWNARMGKTHSFYYQESGTEFESTDSSYELIPVRFNMDVLDIEAGPGPDSFTIGNVELIEVIGEDT